MQGFKAGLGQEGTGAAYSPRRASMTMPRQA
jgi:hypothetical protein